jgi:hypothetical protein
VSYQFTIGTPRLVKRLRDGVVIPESPANADRIEFLAWLAAGGVVLPADPPPPPTMEEVEAAAVAADPNLIALLDAQLANVYAYVDVQYPDNPASIAAFMTQFRKDFKTVLVAVKILGTRTFR